MSTTFKKHVVFVILGVVVLFNTTDSRAETDIAQFLNDALAKKSLVNRTREVEYWEEICTWNGDTGRGSTRCFGEKRKKTQPFQDHARVATPFVESTSDLKFDSSKATSLPESVLLQSGRFSNCASPLLNAAVSLSVSGTQGWSITKSHSITTTKTVSLSGTLTVGVASTSLGVSQSVSLSDSTSKAEQASTTISRSFSGSVTLKNGEATDVDLIAYQTTADVPFSADVIVDGNLEPNNSGYTKASQLLSKSERTLLFAGTSRLTGVSEGLVRQRPAAVKIDCSVPENKGKSQSLLTEDLLVAESISPVFLKTFATPKRLSESSLAVAGGSRTLADGPVIGTPDGIRYEIVSTSQVTRMTPACGFNDLGVPKGGTYVIETRRYEQWSKGTLVGQWNNTVETFQGCAAGP